MFTVSLTAELYLFCLYISTSLFALTILCTHLYCRPGFGPGQSKKAGSNIAAHDSPHRKSTCCFMSRHSIKVRLRTTKSIWPSKKLWLPICDFHRTIVKPVNIHIHIMLVLASQLTNKHYFLILNTNHILYSKTTINC